MFLDENVKCFGKNDARMAGISFGEIDNQLFRYKIWILIRHKTLTIRELTLSLYTAYTY